MSFCRSRDTFGTHSVVDATKLWCVKTIPVLSPPSVSGHVFRRERKSGDRWMAKWRGGGGPHQRVLGKVWSGRGKPAAGHMTKRGAQHALDEILTDARRGQLLGQVR